MYKNNVEMRVLVNGRPVREYPHKGMTFIESRVGSVYTIKIKNDNGTRVMAVVSVDGLDVITGKPAEKTNKGYIVDAYSSTEIKGYRTSDEKSVDFVFVSKDGNKNYVAQVEGGDKRNSGVIGIRVFEEKPEKVKVIEKHIHHNHYPINPWMPYTTVVQPAIYYGPTASYSLGSSGTIYGSTTSTSATANTCNVSLTSGGVGGQSLSYTANSQGMSKGLTSPGVSARSVDNSVNNKFDIKNMTEDYYVPVGGSNVKNDFDAAITTDSFDTGTGWGKEKTDLVKKEYFRKGKIVGELVLYYASTEALIGMGVDLSTTPTIAEVKKKLPKAFGNSEYCQPPKGWVR
jgi:hypothetical protein